MEGEATVWIAMILLAGLIALWAGAREAMVQHRLRRKGIHARGLVVGHSLRGAGKDGGPPSRTAVVEFVDARGSRHTLQPGMSGVKGLPVGGEVPVRYLLDAPEGARIDRTGKRVGEVGFPLVLGTLFTAIGIWMLATGR
ncbi:DUF3592 domain-containing protein [Streptomyces sp. NPDC048445]|uniref:DUF3592 domain-containing protein n=1 Tax=Streptomyces sp. NPDC048445 TaxID=3365553 RepID=UPI0037245460